MLADKYNFTAVLAHGNLADQDTGQQRSLDGMTMARKHRTTIGHRMSHDDTTCISGILLSVDFSRAK